MINSIRKIICEQANLDIEKLDSATDLADDLGVSELNMVRIMLEVEKQFDVSIPDEAIGDLKSADDIRAFVTQALAKEHLAES